MLLEVWVYLVGRSAESVHQVVVSMHGSAAVEIFVPGVVQMNTAVECPHDPSCGGRWQSDSSFFQICRAGASPHSRVGNRCSKHTRGKMDGTLPLALRHHRPQQMYTLATLCFGSSLPLMQQDEIAAVLSASVPYRFVTK